MIKVVAKNRIKKDKLEEFISLAKKLEEATNKYDEGCLHYAIYQDVEDPQVLTFLEEWESPEALEKHLSAPHFQEIVPQLGAFADGPQDLNIYRKA